MLLNRYRALPVFFVAATSATFIRFVRTDKQRLLAGYCP